MLISKNPPPCPKKKKTTRLFTTNCISTKVSVRIEFNSTLVQWNEKTSSDYKERLVRKHFVKYLFIFMGTFSVRDFNLWTKKNSKPFLIYCFGI